MTPAPTERILVVCTAGSASRPDIEAMAVALARSGAAVTLAIVDLSEPHVAEDSPPDRQGRLRLARVGAPSFPLVCGLGRSGVTAALREAYALALAVGSERFDLLICPLSGGLAHGVLMDRATGLRETAARVALWLDVPARWDVLEDDRSPADLAPLVRDALERAVLILADAAIVPDAQAAARLRGLPEAPPVVWTAPPPLLRRAEGSPDPVAEIVFVGRFSRREGASAFMDAVEELAHRGILGERLVTFLGPLDDASASLGASMLGVRAQRWPFRFRVVDTADEPRILSYLRAPGRLAVFAGCDPDSGRLFRSALAQGGRVVATCGYGGAATTDDGSSWQPAGADAQALADGIEAAFREGGAVSGGDCEPYLGLSPALSAILPRLPPPPPSAGSGRIGSISVCITHRLRPALLAKALASVAAASDGLDVEAVVIDNGGEPPFVPEAANIRVVRLDRPLPQAAAYNRGVEACRGEIVVFLDDDNLLAADGLQAFAGALSTGWFDIAVTTLDLVEGEADSGRSAGRMIFLGDAGMAGLFFNGFGDTALAVRREAFLRIGGFREPGHLAPVLDWEMLARARAAGLRIGVLSEPAIRYALNVGGELRNWLKLDRDGGRRSIVAAYGEAIDGPLLARFAQGLQSCG